MKDRKITTSGFDLSEGEIGRVTRLYVVNRLLPLGYFAGFTRLRQLMVLYVLHSFGAFLFRRLMPYENRLTRIYAKLRSKR